MDKKYCKGCNLDYYNSLQNLCSYLAYAKLKLKPSSGRIKLKAVPDCFIKQKKEKAMPKVSAIKVKTKQVSHNEYNKYNKYLSLVVDYDLRTPNKEKVETACSFTTATAYVNRKRTLAHIVFQNDDETLIRVNLKKQKAEYKSMSIDLLQYHLYVRYEKYLR